MPRLTIFRRLFLPPVLSAVLLWTAFYPLDLGVTSLVALAPFLTLVRAESGRRWPRYLAAFAGGFVFFALAIKWVRVAHVMMMLFTWPAGAFYCALTWPLALYFLRRLDRQQLPFALTLPVVWVAVEYLRAHFPTGFSWLQPLGVYQLVGFHWYALGYSLHNITPAIQCADLGGVHLISASVACCNGIAYEWMMRSNWVRTLFAWPARPKAILVGQQTYIWQMYTTAWAMLFPILLFCYGTVQLSHPPYPPGPRVACIQGNVPQNEKMEQNPDPRVTPPLEVEYFGLAQRAARPRPPELRPDLVVWPETCFPYEWYEAAPELMPATRLASEVGRFAAEGADILKARKLVSLPATNYLLGLNRLELKDATLKPGSYRKYNSAVLIDSDYNATASYDKMHLVPFGEYVPLNNGFLKNFTPYDHDYSCTPGDRYTVFKIDSGAAAKQYRFGVMICYEDSDPYISRQYNWASKRGCDADFLVNISNDGWFAGTEEHAQHLAICQFRAVEARRSVVRAVNTGVSAIIDPDGKVVGLPNPSKPVKDSANTTAILRGEVPISDAGTTYALLGDWVPLACFGFYVAARLWPRLRPRLVRFYRTGPFRPS